MVGCLVYQDESFLHAYEVAEATILAGRASKDGAPRSVEPGTFFIPLPGPAISSQHFKVVIGNDKITVTDMSRSGTIVKHGIVTKPLLKDSYEFDAVTTDRFQVLCESKAVVFKIIITLREPNGDQEDAPTEPIVATTPAPEDNRQAEQAAAEDIIKDAAEQEPEKKKPPAKKRASSTASAEPDKEKAPKKKSTKEVKEKSEKPSKAAKTEKAAGSKPAKKRPKKAAEDASDDDVVPIASTNESFKEFSDNESDDNEDLSLDDTTEESSNEDEQLGDPEESDPNEALTVDECLVVAVDAPPIAYDIDEYTVRRGLMHKPQYEDTSFRDVLDSLGLNMKMCWCNYLDTSMKAVVDELNIRQDQGYAADKVDVFFTNKFRRTARYLLAIHRGIPILSDVYLQRCSKTVLIDASVEWPRARKYLLSVSREEVAANDQSLLSHMPANWSLAQVLARAFRYPVVFVDTFHVIITPEAILNAPMTKRTFAKDFVALYSFGLLVANMGVKTVKVVFEAAMDRYLSRREIEEDLPELNKAPCRALNPDMGADTIEERIVSAAQLAKESDGKVTLVVPPPESPHYEKYRKFNGAYEDTGLTFIQMKRQGIINSILLGEPVFKDHYITA